MKPKIEVYSKSYCPYCRRTKGTLSKLALTFTEYEISNNSQQAAEMRQRSGRKTVPQIFINDQHIGGSDEFHLALKNGALDDLLTATY